MASIRDVARLAGVSIGTVSRYLNGQKLKQSNMEKIASAIDTLDYKENIIAKGLKNHRSFSIGLLMNRISSRFGSEVVSGIEKIAEENDYSLLLSGFSEDSEKNKKKIEYLMKRSVDGLIVFLSGEEWKEMETLKEMKIPIISLICPYSSENVDTLLLNDRQSVFDVISYYVSSGHKKIGYLSAPQSDFNVYERFLGAEKAVKDKNIEMKLVTGDYTRQSGYKGTEELLAWGATAIFVSNYKMSVGALECFNQKGLVIGKDIFFGHYDYLTDAEQSLLPQITINPPAEEMGERAATLLLERIKSASSNEDSINKKVIVMENQVLGLPKEEQ